MALVTARARSTTTGGLHPHLLIDEGRAWARRHDLSIDDGLALEVGYALVFAGDVNISEIYERLGIEYAWTDNGAGAAYPVRLRAEEPSEDAEPIADAETPATFSPDVPARRAKLDVRLTEDERAAIEREAQRRKLPVSTLARELIFDRAERRAQLWRRVSPPPSG